MNKLLTYTKGLQLDEGAITKRNIIILLHQFLCKEFFNGVCVPPINPVRERRGYQYSILQPNL